MADISGDRYDCSSDNLGVAYLDNHCNSHENSATHSASVEQESYKEDIDLSNARNLKITTSSEEYQIMHTSADRNKEKTLAASVDLPLPASNRGSRLDQENSGDNTSKSRNSLQDKLPDYKYDEQLNVYYVPNVADIGDSITEETNTEKNNCSANRETGNDLEEVTNKNDDESSIENLLTLQSESQCTDKLQLVVIDEYGTDQKSLNCLKSESKKRSHIKPSAGFDEQVKESKHTDENIEDIMRYLLSFVTFQVRDVVLYMLPTVRFHPQAIDDIPWNWLNDEKWRLHTYSRYPHGANKSAILLAEAGFAYLGSGKGNDDKVICYFCCAEKQDWQPGDVISEVHKNLSPDCSMLTGVDCDNVPMTMPKYGLHLFNQLHNSREMNVSEDTRQKAGDDIERDGVESSHVPIRQASRQTSPTQSVGKNQNGTSTPARHPRMATQTVMRPNTSATGPSTTNTARFSQPTSSDVPSTTVTSNSIFNSPASSEADPNGFQITVPQAGQNSVPVGTQITDTSNQNVHHLSDQTAVSSSATVVSQVNQGNSSHNQSTSVVTTLSSGTTSTTISSTTSATSSSSLNTPVNQSATLSQETPPPNTSDSQNSARAAGRNPTYGELGIITERPKRYEFAVRAKRLESLEPWPRDHHLKKEDLADAGFYYAGYGDCARCFYCGGGLRNWEDNDNVWVEHARWFPKCAFIRQTMGQQFVDTVQDLNKSHDQITFEMVTNKMGSSAASFQLDTKNMPLKRDPAVITVLGMGYEDKDVMEAADAVKDSFGVLSADKLFEKLEQDGKRRRTTESPAESQAIRNSKESKDEEVMNQLKEQNNQLRQQTVCKICMDKEVAVVFLPCGHLVSCTDCASALKDCPVCRNLVRGIVRAFMA